MAKKTLTAPEVAAHLGVNESTVRRWSMKGSLPYTLNDQGHRIYAEADVKRLEKKATMRTEGEGEHRVYVFESGSTSVTLSEVDWKRMVRLYSSYDGAPWNVDQVCSEFRLTRHEFYVVCRAQGLTHTSLPFTDDEMVSRPEEDLEEEVLKGVRQRLQRRLVAGKTRQREESAAKWDAFEENALALARALAEEVVRPLPPPEAPPLPAASSNLLVLAPTDLHYGKAAFRANGPGAYDREKAKNRLFTHSLKILHRAKALVGEGFETLVLIGSDGCHIDNVQGATTKGTPQAVDGDPIQAAAQSVYMWVEYIQAVLRNTKGPVNVAGMPGNHDRLVTYLTMAAIDVAFRDNPRVKVDGHVRVYGKHRFGKNLILFHHGDGRSSTTDLALTMATQFPQDWADCPHRTALRGNLHHVKDEQAGGIRNLLIPSLSGSDFYHQMNYPVQNRPLMRAPLFNFSEGLIATLETGPQWDADEGDWASW